MSVQVRPANLVGERVALIELFRRLLTPESDEKRFEWLYRASPHGTARVWVACESSDGAVIGAAAAFPRRISFRGQERLGWVLGDFCIDERYRSLGPAVQLQRACLDVAAATPGTFCYDFPSKGMMAIYKRLGIGPAGTLVRWAKPLHATRKIESVVRSRSLAKALGVPAEIALAQRGWKGDRTAGTLQLHEGACGEEFDALNARVCQQPGIFSVRTAEHLNWRYLAHPSAKHEVLTARRGGVLIGYAIFTQQGDEARVVDLCSADEPSLIALLLAGVVRQVRPRGVATVSMNAGDSHPWNAVFERAGFKRREASPVVTYAPGEPLLFSSEQLAAWYLMQGERDS
jgi:GNAT superfamily N-acetyltransferase